MCRCRDARCRATRADSPTPPSSLTRHTPSTSPAGRRARHHIIRGKARKAEHRLWQAAEGMHRSSSSDRIEQYAMGECGNREHSSTETSSQGQGGAMAMGMWAAAGRSRSSERVLLAREYGRSNHDLRAARSLCLCAGRALLLLIWGRCAPWSCGHGTAPTSSNRASSAESGRARSAGRRACGGGGTLCAVLECGASLGLLCGALSCRPAACVRAHMRSTRRRTRSFCVGGCGGWWILFIFFNIARMRVRRAT